MGLTQALENAGNKTDFKPRLLTFSTYRDPIVPLFSF